MTELAVTWIGQSLRNHDSRNLEGVQIHPLRFSSAIPLCAVSSSLAFLWYAKEYIFNLKLLLVYIELLFSRKLWFCHFINLLLLLNVTEIKQKLNLLNHNTHAASFLRFKCFLLFLSRFTMLHIIYSVVISIHFRWDFFLKVTFFIFDHTFKLGSS